MDVEDILEMTRCEESERLREKRKNLGLREYKIYITGYQECIDYYIKLKEIEKIYND